MPWVLGICHVQWTLDGRLRLEAQKRKKSPAAIGPPGETNPVKYVKLACGVLFSPGQVERFSAGASRLSKNPRLRKRRDAAIVVAERLAQYRLSMFTQ